jgi:phage virion morphogenesis protein
MADFIRIEIDDREVRRALKSIQKSVGDLRPFMKVAGEVLVEGTRDRFRTMTDPEGRPWKELSPGYAARKKRNKGRILVLRGRLEGSIGGDTKAHTIRPKNKRALFWPGAAHPVRSVNHPGSHIPARPYLGMGERDRVRILALAEEYLARAANQG